VKEATDIPLTPTIGIDHRDQLAGPPAVGAGEHVDREDALEQLGPTQSLGGWQLAGPVL